MAELSGGRATDRYKSNESLDEKQREQAILKDRTSVLVLGPGRDGKDLKPAGIKGLDLTEKQQELLLELAGAWVNILQEESAKSRLAEIRDMIKETYFGWSGPTDEGSAAYFRPKATASVPLKSSWALRTYSPRWMPITTASSAWKRPSEPASRQFLDKTRQWQPVLGEE
jgi:hypothetical protein